METKLYHGEEETLKLAIWIDKIGIPDVNHKWNKKIHYVDAPISGFMLTVKMMLLGY